MGSCLSTFTELYGIQHSNLKQKWFQGIMTCQKITQVITDFVKTLNQVRTFFRNFRDSSSENHHVKAQFLEREKKLRHNSEDLTFIWDFIRSKVSKFNQIKVFPPYRSLHISDSSEEQSDNDHVYVLRILQYVYACTISNKSLCQKKKDCTQVLLFSILRKHDKLFNYSKYLRPATSMSLAILNIVLSA